VYKVGGPDTFTHKQLAELAFEVLDKPAKIAFLPDWLRRFLVLVVPWVTPAYIGGPTQFFLIAFGMDMVGESVGDHHLRDFFRDAASKEDRE